MPEQNLQPVLEGDLVIIRPLADSDWDDLFTAASDPGIWEQHPAKDRYQEAVFREYFDDAMAGGGAFAFVDRSSGDIIGSSRYHGLDTERSEVEIGWTFLARAYWGGKYNREIKALMLEHAFTIVDTVVFMVGEKNQRSRRAVEKIGGVLRPGETRRNMADHVLYAIDRENYSSIRE